MTHIEQAIKEAVEKGGYQPFGTTKLKAGIITGWAKGNEAKVLLDPNFWSAFGKARGWQDSGKEVPPYAGTWKMVAVNFMAHLMMDKTAEEFFATLV